MTAEPNVLEAWITAACGALDLTDLSDRDRRAVLDLARDVAHGVVRPAAPLTAFLLGLAVGRGADLATAAATLTRLAGDWPDRRRSGGSDQADD
jgi:hypothetical protein